MSKGIIEPLRVVLHTPLLNLNSRTWANRQNDLIGIRLIGLQLYQAVLPRMSGPLTMSVLTNLISTWSGGPHAHRYPLPGIFYHPRLEFPPHSVDQRPSSLIAVREADAVLNDDGAWM